MLQQHFLKVLLVKTAGEFVQCRDGGKLLFQLSQFRSDSPKIRFGFVGPILKRIEGVVDHDDRRHHHHCHGNANNHPLLYAAFRHQEQDQTVDQQGVDPNQ